jgi:hypothetical protein
MKSLDKNDLKLLHLELRFDDRVEAGFPSLHGVR